MGIAFISGTGSVAFGIDEAGKTHRAGGYGYQEGDLGSAYHLGKEAIKIAVRVFDKRLPETNFSRELMDVLEINSVDDLLNRIITFHNDRTKIASLAPFVTKHTNLGNKEARLICDEAIRELTLDIQAVYQNISLTNKEIAIIGSLGNSEGYFSEYLHKSILKIDKEFIIHKPLIEPVMGSAYQALKNDGINVR